MAETTSSLANVNYVSESESNPTKWVEFEWEDGFVIGISINPPYSKVEVMNALKEGMWAISQLVD